jgi:hypothetical protein
MNITGNFKNYTIGIGSRPAPTTETKEDFIKGYCERSNVAWAWLSERRKVISCTCGEENCRGWAMVTHDHEDFDTGEAE